MMVDVQNFSNVHLMPITYELPELGTLNLARRKITGIFAHDIKKDCLLVILDTVTMCNFK
jgi:hypothetical protein